MFSKKKADAISNGVFLISLAFLFYFNFWWPGILLSLWAMLAIRQYLTARHYDFVITSVILLGLFTIYFFHLEWSMLMPALFFVGGIYIIFREYYFSEEPTDRE
jgi:hypothetical protein